MGHWESETETNWLKKKKKENTGCLNIWEFILKPKVNKSTENPDRLCVQVGSINSITYSTLQQHYMNLNITHMSNDQQQLEPSVAWNPEQENNKGPEL